MLLPWAGRLWPNSILTAWLLPKVKHMQRPKRDRLGVRFLMIDNRVSVLFIFFPRVVKQNETKQQNAPVLISSSYDAVTAADARFCDSCKSNLRAQFCHLFKFGQICSNLRGRSRRTLSDFVRCSSDLQFDFGLKLLYAELKTDILLWQNPRQSNWRSAVQWYFSNQSNWVFFGILSNNHFVHAMLI